MKEREVCHAIVHRVAEWDMTEGLNSNNKPEPTAGPGDGREKLRQLAFYTCVAAETLGVCWCGSQPCLGEQGGTWVAASANKTSCGVESAGAAKAPGCQLPQW